MNRLYRLNLKNVSWVLVAAFILGGCAGTPVMVSPNFDFSKIKRVAILGFEPYQDMENSGKGMASVFEKYFIQAGYRLVERQNVAKIMKEQNFELSGAVDPQQAVHLGKVLGVDALVMGNVTVYTPEKSSVVMIDIDSVEREPVITRQNVEVVRDGKRVTETVEVVSDYRVTHHREKVPQVYKVGAEAGVVVKMIDATTGEIAWVGTDTEQASNIHMASEYVAERILKALKKYWPVNQAKK